MNDPVVGGYEGYFLPEPVATGYGSFYTDYMTYLDIADLDSVLAAQVASPGSQITIQFIALALEGAEEKAKANEQTLNEYLENRTIADLVDQFTQEENCAWLTSNDFFRGNNVALSLLFVKCQKHPMTSSWETLSHLMSRWLMLKALVKVMVKARPQHSMTPFATAQSGTSQETAGLSRSSASGPRTVLGAEAPPGLLAIEDVKPDEYYNVTAQVREFISRSTRCSLGPEHPHAKDYTKVAIPGLLPYLDDYIMSAHDPFVEDFHWSMDDNRHTESKSRELTEGDVPKLLLLQIVMSSGGSEYKQPALRSQQLGETSEVQEPLLRPRSSVTDKVSRSMS